MKNVLFVVALFFLSHILLAQGVTLTGNIVDEAKQNPLAGVHVIVVNLKDTTLRYLTNTGIDGTFLINGLNLRQPYKVFASYVGFRQITRMIILTKQLENAGTLSMHEEPLVLKEVVIQGQAAPVIQKGDTTEMNASGYKVHPDASTKDLVRKMPGVTVENGTVKAHGEEVKRILVDGKNYFGDDPSMALQNLPAEVVDKIQIYNKMSDQAEFTGFDDGQSSKVMNIVTRIDKRWGTTGTFAAGSDFQNKYNINGRFSNSENQHRLTLITGINNVNQQNFATRDFQGTIGEGATGLRGGQREGINTTGSFGVNYADYVAKKFMVTGSYFFNAQKNVTNKLSNIMHFSSNDTSDIDQRPNLYSNQSIHSTGNKQNNRFDLRVEYSIDSANSVIWSPKFNTQRNDRDAELNQLNYYTIETPVLNSLSNNKTKGPGYNYASDLLFKHKFLKKRGRTITVGMNLSGNFQDIDGMLFSLTAEQNKQPGSIDTDTSLLHKASDAKIKSTTLSSSLVYTEPVGKYGLLQLNYKVEANINKSEKFSFDLKTVPAVLDSNLSNVYQNKYFTHSGGISYRVRGKGEKLTTTLGIDYQKTKLSGVYKYPQSLNTIRAYDNVLPNAVLNYTFSKKANLRILYRTSVHSPLVSELQNVVTIFNLLSFSQGNSSLKNEYNHNGSVNIRLSNPAKLTNYSVNLNGGYTRNKIGNALYIMRQDSAIIPGDTLKQTGQLRKPMNFDKSWNARIFLNYGVLVKPLKCNFNFIGGGGYTMQPSLINSVQNTTHQYNLTGGIVIGSNFDENIDFTFSYTTDYAITDFAAKETNDYAEITQNIKTVQESWFHGISFESNLIWKRFSLQNNILGQINRGLSVGYSQDYLRWDISLGKKLFRTSNGEIKLSILDVFNQNNNITHSVSDLNISDSRTNMLHRYFLLTFTYSFKNYKSPSSDHSGVKGIIP